MVHVTIDGKQVEARKDSLILAAAEAVDIYIPRLCHHPDLPPAHGLKPTGKVYWGNQLIENNASNEEVEYPGCELCVVQIEGKEGFVRACETVIEEGMVIHTQNPDVQQYRREKLSKILGTHPHACLTCAQREGCSREPCSPNVPVNERCCEKFGRCELQRVSEYIGIREDTPRYIPRNLPIVKNEPLFIRDYNLCISCTRCVRACNDLREVNALGVAYNGEDFIVGTNAPTLSESACKFCGACVEVCPTGALLDQEVIWTNREEVLLPCVHNCPLEIDIPEYIRQVGKGDYTQATAVVRNKAALPAVLAHVCHHPCETKCRRTDLNEAICILGLKRVAVENDTGDWKKNLTVGQSTDKRIAIIGSGPAGLSAAYHLTRLGHSITVFESQTEPGGMLRFGIPSYRLPRVVLDSDIKILTNLGIDIKTDVTIGDGLTIPTLQKEGYNVILIAIGTQENRKIQIEGNGLQGVHWGLDFLKEVNSGARKEIGRRIVVVGGGSVAIDVARTAVRLGAEQVILTCLEAGEEMPAHPWEIEEAVEEGIEIQPSWGPKRILGNNGQVIGIELIRCTCVFDEEGSFSPAYNEDESKTIEADAVYLAIGQAVDLSGISQDIKLSLSESQTIAIDYDTHQTNLPRIFATGDAATGPTSVVEAMATGLRAAACIDEFLGGTGEILEGLSEKVTPPVKIGHEEQFVKWTRKTLPLLPVKKRINSFDEVELALSKEQASDEAKRCLQCDLRLQISPVTLPPEDWEIFDSEHIEQVPEGPGVFTIADGDKVVLAIKGTETLRATLEGQLATLSNAKYFKFEEDPLYTKRETELLQQYIQDHGKMPSEDELDDLF